MNSESLNVVAAHPNYKICDFQGNLAGQLDVLDGQAPPLIRVRSRAFGTGRQIPIVAQTHSLPEEAVAVT